MHIYHNQWSNTIKHSILINAISFALIITSIHINSSLSTNAYKLDSFRPIGSSHKSVSPKRHTITRPTIIFTDGHKPGVGKDRDEVKVSVKFDAFNKTTFLLALSKDMSFISPHFATVYTTGDTNLHKLPFKRTNTNLNDSSILEECYYSGELIGDSQSKVVMNMCHKGVLHGLIYSPIWGDFLVEPLEYCYHNNINEKHTDTRNPIIIDGCWHVLYKMLQSSKSQANCETKDNNSSNNSQTRVKNISKRIKRSYSYERHIEIMVVADSKMAYYHGDNLRHYILTLMATVALIYRDASIGNAINIAIVKLTVMDEEEGRDLIYASASKTLRHFCRWQHIHNQDDDSHPYHHDTAILLTREDLCRMPKTCDTLGLAQSGQICDPSASCAVIEDNGLSAAFTIAHELGHVLSIPHDDDDKCMRFREEGQRHHIMARMLDYNSHPWTWSTCSRHYITEYLDGGNGDCLLDKPSENLLNEAMSRSHIGGSTVAELRQPGELFDMDLQCELVFGPSSKICPYMPVCKRLWCTISSDGGGCRTQHMPWADGTPCAQNKWCQQGECVAIKRIESHPIDGEWGPWSSYSQCSRNCGGGIQRSFRECDQPKPQFGGKYCTGHRIRYRSCNTHECTSTTIDFREEQCVAFNGQTFNINGLPPNVKWTPHYTGIVSSDSCKLYCNVMGTGAYYLLKQKVIDGTPCAPDSYDICVNGKCMNAGCDHILGSQVRPDSCGVCGGDNSTCKIISGHFHQVKYGYNLVVVVPIGATNLDIRQYGSSSTDDNYLALKSYDSTYILNGDFVVSMFHKTMQYGGVTIEYSGSNDAIERINSSKPLTRQLYVEVLSVGNLSSPDVSYHYAISLERDKYEWHMNEKWSDCSRVCNGEQMLSAQCFVANHSKTVDDAYCTSETRPTPKAQVCNMHCQLIWKTVKQWECSAACGVGTKKRLIRCTQELNTGEYHELHDHYCQHIGPKPEEYIACNGSCRGFNWVYSEWSDCSVSCGQGMQVRSAKCVDSDGNEKPLEDCDAVTPRLTKQTCQVDECPHWESGQWNSCSEKCGIGEKHRKILCKHGNQVINDGYCDSEMKPHSVEICQIKACSGKWYFGEWSACIHCSPTSQRVVRCRSSTGDLLSNEDCNLKEKPIDSRECHYTNGSCNNTLDILQSIEAQRRGQWRTGMWSQCSSSCGFGIKKRYVACLDEDTVLHDHECDLDSKPDSEEKCEVICNDLLPNELHQWRVGLWGECSTLCNEGLQRRLVLCYHHNGHIVEESLCDSTKRPNDTQTCDLHKCEGNWKTSNWSECSKSCGNEGIQSRRVDCIDEKANIIADHLCYKLSKPKTESACNVVECPKQVPYEWRLSHWEECKSTVCDGNGTQKRRVFCVNNNDESVALHFCGTVIPIRVRDCVSKVKCSPNQNIMTSISSSYSITPTSITTYMTTSFTSTTPLSTSLSTTLSTSSQPVVSSQSPTTQSLNLITLSSNLVTTRVTKLYTKLGPKWILSEWSQCSVSCGNGTQTREPLCDSHIQTDCNPEEKPNIERRHCSRLCSLFQWKWFPWSECSTTCGKGYKSRLIQCLDWTNSVVPNQFCDPSTKPKNIRRCKRHACPFLWQTSHWSQCTNTCGQGVQVRTVTCHRVNKEGWIDSQPAKKRKLIKEKFMGWCNETLKPISKRICNFGDCERGAVWKPSTWQPCSTSCGSGKQRRRVPCFSLKGKKLPRTQCDAKFRPQRRRKCNLRPCAPISCYDIHKRGNVITDGEYDIYIRGILIKIYCHDMESGRPIEYLTLKSGYIENFSEIYNKRPTKADVCPYRGVKCENCVTNDARIGGGLTQFMRIRINITSLLVFTNDFRFAETRDGGWKIAYGEAGDCYSTVDCPQGQFKINLKDTGLSVSSKTRWLVQGNKATKQIDRLDNGEIVIGRCGGYCGRCTPANGLYLDLST